MIEPAYAPLETLSHSYLYYPPMNGGFGDDVPMDGGGGGGGSGPNGYFDPNHYWNLTDSGSMVQSNGYVLADYNHDNTYDQAWYADSNGDWWTNTDGEWRRDDGPMEEWEWLEDQEPE